VLAARAGESLFSQSPARESVRASACRPAREDSTPARTLPHSTQRSHVARHEHRGRPTDRDGRGGVGVVYLAEDLRLHRKVALKLIAPELAENERFRERFLAESELAASLDHPNVVPIYEADEAEGVLFIAMRHVEGLGAARHREPRPFVAKVLRSGVDGFVLTANRPTTLAFLKGLPQLAGSLAGRLIGSILLTVLPVPETLGKRLDGVILGAPDDTEIPSAKDFAAARFDKTFPELADQAFPELAGRAFFFGSFSPTAWRRSSKASGRRKATFGGQQRFQRALARLELDIRRPVTSGSTSAAKRSARTT
jgi:hypothetical protein